jgi:DNA replication protein DnaC
MEQLKNLIPDSLKADPSQISESTEEILTPEEIQDVTQKALGEARRLKRAAIKTEEYRKKIMAEKAPIQVSAEQFYAWIWNKAKNEVKNFGLNGKERDMYELLCQYFTGDKKFEEKGYSLDKGLMLYGGVGCGKTTIMKLFRDNPGQTFGVVECMKISDEYKDKEGGADIIHRYSFLPSICFNDLGTEIESGESSHFGNKKNVMAEIILNHYERNNEKKFRLHFTTNLNADMQEKYYGPRVRSRLREMCNIISLVGIEDKRK